MALTSNFNIWLLTFITEDDKSWLESTDYIYRRETGAKYQGQDCWIIFPKEKYLGFLILKFGNRLIQCPVEEYRLNSIYKH